MKISRIGPVVILDDEDVEPERCVDHFLAAQVRMVTTEWDDDGKRFIRITFLDGGKIEWFWDATTSSDVARAVWPELNPPRAGSLLEESEKGR